MDGLDTAKERTSKMTELNKLFTMPHRTNNWKRDENIEKVILKIEWKCPIYVLLKLQKR